MHHNVKFTNVSKLWKIKMKTENLLDKLIAEYKQDRKMHPIKWMWIDFKSWVITNINWVRITIKRRWRNKLKY